ncbi:TSUP family transporter [uncultured Azohydromonas sp.]|uniref:TSUP family transporter n=1 Tax=uncultured Azohydromonas sp. TaxID=487342 RepID=UPI002616D626|nr:TSUP family transporter [uncultured Azohydromonas sp.]
MRAAGRHARHGQGFVAGSLLGALGGLAGLSAGGLRSFLVADLVGRERPQGFIVGQAMSLLAVACALLFRASAIPLDLLVDHADVLAYLLAGSLAGDWWAAGSVAALSRRRLDRAVVLLLALGGLWLLLLAAVPAPALAAPDPLRQALGVLAGVAVGMATAVLGVVGSALLIPVLVLLYGIELKVAGSLALLVSLPTLVTGFMRHARVQALDGLRRERALVGWMAAGGVAGAALGALLLGLVPAQALLVPPGLVLLAGAVKVHRAARP